MNAKQTSPVSVASSIIRSRTSRTTKAGATVIQSKVEGKSADAPKVAASPMPTVATVGNTVAQISASMKAAQAKQTKADKAAYAARPNAAVSAGEAPATPVAFGPAPTQDGLRLTHAIKDGFRPSAGAALFAHTSVFLTHARLDKQPMPSALVDTFLGARAIAYHKAQGNLVTVADKRNADGSLIHRGGLMLTPDGIALFAKRKPDAELYSAFENVLCRGEVDDRVVKNPAALIQVAAK